MLFERPELESGEELEQLSKILEAEEGNDEERPKGLASRRDRAIDEHLTQIILRREGESRKDYGERVDRFISYLRFQEDTSYITAEISRLNALKKSRKNLAKRLMNMILYRLEISKVNKIETNKYKISVVGKGGKQPVEIDYDETHDLDLFPEEFVKTKTVKTIDRDAIAAHLKAGKPLTWARLVERGNRLSIK
ncbi:siphovirus Gp157 family protein [Pleurocapsales cyanobacterium LEGE 10410]|nr:siphovirus Gp157 family protein [Pleurocapsales cyanobacterium LEGE 10410]